MSNERIIEKIKKCLALSRSANEHEAAAALRQAQALMRQHRIEMSDVEMSEISESTVAASVKRSPPRWENNMMLYIAKAFGCEIIFYINIIHRADWVFVGGSSEVLVAKYSADVLLRQVRAARRVYIEERLSRCKNKTKTARADAFCLGWVYTACALLEKYERHGALDGYMALKHNNDLTDLAVRDRTTAAGKRGFDDFVSGGLAGKSAQLHDGVGAGPQRKMIGG